MLSRLLLLLGFAAIVTTVTTVLLQSSPPLKTAPSQSPSEKFVYCCREQERDCLKTSPTECTGMPYSDEAECHIQCSASVDGSAPQGDLSPESTEQSLSSEPSPEEPYPSASSVIEGSPPSPQEPLAPNLPAASSSFSVESTSPESPPTPVLPVGEIPPPLPVDTSALPTQEEPLYLITPPQPTAEELYPAAESLSSGWCCSEGQCVFSPEESCPQPFASPLECITACSDALHEPTVWCCRNGCSEPLPISTCDGSPMYTAVEDCLSECLGIPTLQDPTAACPDGCTLLNANQKCTMGKIFPANPLREQAGIFSRFFHFLAQLVGQEIPQQICCCPLKETGTSAP